MFSVCLSFLCFQITFCYLDTYLLLMFSVTTGSCVGPSALVAENLNVCHGVFTLNRNLFSLSFSFFVRAPVKDSIRSTYSFVHMLLTMLAAVYHCDYTISSGAGGPNTKRSLCHRGMDHRVQELARSRTRFFPVGSGTLRRNVEVGNIILPYHIHHLDKLPGHLDISSIAVFLAAVGHPIKHHSPFAAGANRTVSGLNEGPFKCPVAPDTKMTPQRRMPGIVLTGII